ncbi:MAG: hypothetical protein GX754_07720 [Clostridiaceae bacterium]|nr:hypothetical protein [Clostridiaceae bacterium]
MNNRKNLHSIANAIYAADKILNLLNKKQGQGADEITAGWRRAYPDMAVFGEITKIIANYLPGSEDHRGNHLKRTVDKCAFYEDTYKKLKQHLVSVKNEGLNGDRIFETLAAIKPYARRRQKTAIDKSMKIYKILKS